MKIAIIGGAGVRTPLLVNGLTASDLPISEIALFDHDAARLEAIAPLVRDHAHRASVQTTQTSAEAITGADFVITSIRVGGIEARAADEQVSLDHGIAGQETVGPAGFAMALRTIPHIVRYAEEVASLAPDAWMVNFTNPVGIVTQAVQTATPARIVGICDTPTELFEEAAHALGVPSGECFFDYLGLNHLGWIREIYYRGRPMLQRLLDDPPRLAAIYRVPLFEAEFLRSLGLLPTEYVYYYYRAADAVEHLKRAGQSRGTVIAALNRDLFEQLSADGADRVALYERYLENRDAGYMQLESGAEGPRKSSPWGALTGYDKIALSVIRGIHFNSGAIIPLNVRNAGNLPDLEADDVVEISCAVNANGPRPMHVGRVPSQVRDLLTRVKHYERLTVRAGLTRDREDARRALAANPLIEGESQAAGLIDALSLEL